MKKKIAYITIMAAIREIRHYIPLKDIVDYTANEDGLQIYTSDTSDDCGCWWEGEEK